MPRIPHKSAPDRRPRARFALESLEPRDVPAAGTLLAVGADAGGGPRVTLLDRGTGAVVQSFFAYEPSFTGGVRVAVGDFNGDGTADVVTAPGAGIAARIKVFDGATGAVLKDFPALDGFTGGANVAVGDVNGDGTPDVVAGADAGGGPRVEVFDGKSGAVLQDFFAFPAGFGGGVRVAAGDVNGDGKADVIAGAGAGGGPAVGVFDGATAGQLASFFAYAPNFGGGVYVAAADLTGDGRAEVVTGAGAGGGPAVSIFDGLTGAALSSFFAYDPSFLGGVRVGAYALDATGRPGIVTAPGTGGSTDVRLFSAPGGIPSALFSALDTAFTGGAFAAGGGLPAAVSKLAGGLLGNFFNSAPTGPVLIDLQLKPLDVNLLGLELKTDPIEVTLTVEPGDGKLLGNLLDVVSNLVNLKGVNAALNNVLGNVVTLLDSASLSVAGGGGSGTLSTAPAAATSLLDLFVAPVHLDLLGARVDTSPIHLTLTAQSGNGLVLGNVLADLANLFNPPLPATLDLNTVNAKLQDLLAQLNAQIPGIPSAPFTPSTTPITGTSQVLRLTVPPINLDLLGLTLQTDQIQVNADALTGDGLLLGNVLTTLLNTLGATPQNLTDLNNNLNALLAKVVGVLNASSLALAPGAVAALTPVLQTLSLPDLVNTSGAPATAPVLNLSIASPDGSTPPVNVNLLGLKITTSNVQAQLAATTGNGQVLGNLVYNVAHLLDPGGSLNLLTVLNNLAL